MYYPYVLMCEAIKNGINGLAHRISELASGLNTCSQGVKSIKDSFENQLFSDDEPLDGVGESNVE